MNESIISNKLTGSERRRVFFFRNIFIPFVEFLGGKKYPAGRVTEHKYGELPDEKLDYIKANTNYSPQIPIIHIHGGGWVAGSKNRIYSKPLLKFSDAGYPVFSLNYPLAPENPHPYILRSLLRALTWIKKNHPEYQSIHLIGDSAGGNLAMMLGIFISNPKILDKIDHIDSYLLPKVKSIVSLYGIMDRFSWIEDGFPGAKTFLKSYAGEQALDKNLVLSIPITPMDITETDNLPPVFIIGAAKDKLLRSSKIYADYLTKNFKKTDYKVYEGASHGFFSIGKKSDELHEDLLSYFNKFKI